MRPVKRSLTIAGHRTSVSLEDPFWQALREIAERRGTSVAMLVTEIDRARGLDAGRPTGLATMLRLFVLAHFRARAAEAEAQLRASTEKPVPHPGRTGGESE